jgi:UDP-glucoronosyl and UDP-glucosyl transferase
MNIGKFYDFKLTIFAADAYASGMNLVTYAKLPFSAMWSPAFVPKPNDWPEQCEVVGTFVVDQKTSFDVSPFADLEAWLEKGDKPIFIGFGSMMIKYPFELAENIKAAAHMAKVRVVVQSGWTKLDVEDGSGLLHNVGPCPHDWLLPKCCAVVHHGGAGTVAAGLRYGLPTMVCPFFADQFMWGYFVELAGVGPKAFPVNVLTAEKLAKALEDLSSPTLQRAAIKLSKEMAKEDGIQGGHVHFMDCLPRENMLCDVSLLLGETVPARYELIGTGLRNHGIKVSAEVAALLEADNKLNWKTVWKWCPTSKDRLTDRYIYAAGIRRHAVTSYNLSGHITHFHHGCFAAFSGLIFGALAAVMEIFMKADQYARSQGAFGCLFGLAISGFYVLIGAFIAVVIFLDRLAVGIANGLLGYNYDFLIDPSWKAKVHDTPVIEAEKETFLTNGIPKARRSELHEAMNMVVKARIVFQSCKPFFPKEHCHFVVVPLSKLVSMICSDFGKQQLKMTDREVQRVVKKLGTHSLPPMQSFRRASMFPAAKQFSKHFLHPQTIPEDDDEAEKIEEPSELTTADGSFSNVNESVNGRPTPTKQGSSGSVTSNERPTPTKQGSSGSVTSGSTAKGKFLDIMSHVNPMNLIHARKSAEATNISFSLFIQALQTVCKDKCLYQSRRRSAISVSLTNMQNAQFEGFPEYLT